MIRPEFSHERDLTYNEWHKTLTSGCYMTDLDAIEYRSIRGKYPVIVAIIECKDYRFSEARRKKVASDQILIQIANALNVPAYLVIHNCNKETKSTPEKWKFKVRKLTDNNREKTFNVEEYINFLKNLGLKR